MQFLPPDIEAYTDAHCGAEPEYLQALSRETWQKMVMPRMLSGHVQGRFLSMVANMVRPKKILEIGTYTGYSALCLAEGLREGGELLTIDINDELHWMHEKYFAFAPKGTKITSLYGDARTLVETLHDEYDLIFIDADKASYAFYFDVLLPKLSANGVMLLDNVLWSGKVTQAIAPSDIETRTLVELNKRISDDERLEKVLLPLRDGMMMLRKKDTL